ncbi:ester cyclase [Actinokineospora auranticolor]|uniref:SnoaL-like polyketide cyclase n=1 Tax=Actinokineospora auranticolor TaxID=155976 RepID=A0A2S6GTY3_9PSEU|nr:ester cyclase [Actinokineospora auranticolor]PPK68581.1 SnoaL-like polyketide cyclase [Actinokineospora auranticolor]
MNSIDTGLLDNWLALWNGDYILAYRLVTNDFTVHAALLDGGDGSALNGPTGLVGWITKTRAAFPDLRFTVEVGPIADGDHVALRWVATGTYDGGFPGATARPGTPVRFTGTDFLRMAGDRIAEYWLNSDTHLLVTQLGVRP